MRTSGALSLDNKRMILINFMPTKMNSPNIAEV